MIDQNLHLWNVCISKGLDIGNKFGMARPMLVISRGVRFWKERREFILLVLKNLLGSYPSPTVISSRFQMLKPKQA